MNSDGFAQLATWTFTIANTVLVVIALILVSRVHRHVTSELAIMRALHGQAPSIYESKPDADRRESDMWAAVNDLRKSSGDFSRMAAERYVTRQELQGTITDLKNDQRQRHAELLTALGVSGER